MLMKYNKFMRKVRILLALGVWIMVLPYLGFPYSWKGILSILTGLVLVCFSYILHRNYKKEEISKSEEKIFDNFRENSDFDKNKEGKEEIIKLNQEEI